MKPVIRVLCLIAPLIIICIVVTISVRDLLRVRTFGLAIEEGGGKKRRDAEETGQITKNPKGGEEAEKVKSMVCLNGLGKLSNVE